MRVTILALGSRGDVQPLLAFALGLKRTGHRVRLATYPRFEPMVVSQAIEFRPLAEGALSRGGQTRDGRWWARKGQFHVPTWVGFLRDAGSVAQRRLTDAAAACEDSDVVVASNLAVMLGSQIALHMDVPLVRVLFQPPDFWLSPHSGSRTTAAARQLAWLAARPWLNSVRRQALGLPKLPLREPTAALGRQMAPVLFPVSPDLFPAAPGMGQATAMTGYLFLDGSLDPDPSQALIDFLQTGEPPVCVSFGSQIDVDPEHTTQTIVQSLRTAGRRGVLLRSAEQIGNVALGADVLAVPAVSHAWLFPRCAAVVHHAGAGTTAAGLRAGVPTVPVPHHSDQHSWAKRTYELGLASRPIPRRRLSSPALAQAIITATTDRAIAERAAAFGETIRAQDGVRQAIAHFEQWVAAPPRQPARISRRGRVRSRV